MVCDVRQHVCQHFGYCHGDYVLHDSESGAKWFVVIGVWDSEGKPALLLWRDGASGAGILDPLPPDMRVLKQIHPHKIREHLESSPQLARNFSFKFLAGQGDPVVRKFDVSAEACAAFGFQFGDVVQDKRRREHTIIGVARPAAGRHWCKSDRIRLWAIPLGGHGAQPLKVDSNLRFVRQGPKPEVFGPLGALECTFRYPVRSSILRVCMFDIRPDICFKLSTVPGLQHGAQVQDEHGRVFSVVGVAYYRGRPRIWFEREGKAGATIFERPISMHKLKVVGGVTSLEPSASDVPTISMESTLDWDKASDSDGDGPVADLKGLLGSDVSPAKVLQALEEAVKHKRQRPKREPLDKLLHSASLNKEDGIKRIEHAGIKQGDRVRSLLDLQTRRRVGIVTNIEGGVFRIDSLEGSGQRVCTWHAKLEEIRKDEEADLVRPGALVKLRPEVQKPRFGWGGLSSQDVVGVVQKVDNCVVSVNLGFSNRWHGMLDEFLTEQTSDALKVGSHVRVKELVEAPRYGWGAHKMHAAVGVVSKIEEDEIEVNFPDADDWKPEAELSRSIFAGSAQGTTEVVTIFSSCPVKSRVVQSAKGPCRCAILEMCSCLLPKAWRSDCPAKCMGGISSVGVWARLEQCLLLL